MIHFNKHTIEFLQELAENNNSNWFNNNKNRFEEYVKKPFHDFVVAISQELQKIEKVGMALPKDCIFRLNRDVRFSEDKSPYKTFVSALISPYGRKNKAYPGFYIQISSIEIRIYSGCHDLTPKQLKSVRQKIHNEPEKFKMIISDKEFIKVFGEVKGEKNKKIPHPFSELVDEIPQIANKEFYYFTTLPVKAILQSEFPSKIIDKYSSCLKLNEFFKEGLK
jgi:uncharacterized protein (TIGR02453 family)